MHHFSKKCSNPAMAQSGENTVIHLIPKKNCKYYNIFIYIFICIYYYNYYYCSLKPLFKVKVHLSSTNAVNGNRASKFATILEYVYKEVNQVLFLSLHCL